MSISHGYTMFNEFMEKFLPQGFINISREDPFVIDLEQKLSNNHQFFYIFDLLHQHLLFTSLGCRAIIGVAPDQFDLSSLFSQVHPDDFQRFSRARSMVTKKGYELSMKQDGISILSTGFKVKDASGNYFNLLFQVYSFYCEIPDKKVFSLVLLTDLSTFHLDPHGFHYYIGEDPALFRYPDEALLQVGHIFSDREFEIIKMIAAGMGSEQIADKLFISVSTVDTHRRNILKKTKKSTTHDLVIELQERGIL